MKSLLCFGDSNTHGTVPMRARDEVSRFDFTQRWPGVVQALLGNDWRVIEEGLPGRTTSFDDPDEGQDRNALRYWQACLQSHRPVDAIVIMLGTNDLKAKFNASPEAISNGLNRIADMALKNTPPGVGHPFILVVVPTPILEVGFFSDLFAGGAKKSLQLAETYSKAPWIPGVQHLDAANHCVVSRIDGIHLDATAHKQLGCAVARATREAFSFTTNETNLRSMP
jgi:lysophospholipase L1-like esterase